MLMPRKLPKSRWRLDEQTAIHQVSVLPFLPGLPDAGGVRQYYAPRWDREYSHIA